MDLQGKVAIVTGGAGGIGAALCRHFRAAGARGVVVADRDADRAAAVAAECGGLAVAGDVGVEADVRRLVAETVAAYGAVDVFCANAGVGYVGGEEASDDDWARSFQVNMMAHVYAARAVIPGMLARGSGYIVVTASAAGLLTMLEGAPYAVSKHAAVAFAEFLAIRYWDRGLRVSCLCPMAVRTAMMAGDHISLRSVAASGAILEPEQVADAVVAGMAEERFLILPHPEVARFVAHRAADRDGWLAAMRKFAAKLG
ncbi:MAG TPA: SDR family NAD(P)-dependent oxidoreductase [Haliangiales bacterium]|nr:SDR family NAD(P)-dependent oxidoreductase [Haliangiales bacterium]